MNPSLAVKQYSRSSADQEVPLPHELRPVKVLRMTMTYLMAKIMNLCDTIDVNFAEWYHFLWDRTRGIRKDITQQELCSIEAVELVEQCARFHIHCSARLVAEDPSTFDQKINTENLTKCLQTLKYMYHDLELKGIYCKNEAEFRAYIILLNLNDGNFMWEVQQLRENIQKSREVRFAMEIYSALDKNNYVRFFKLVHSTTYLNACILLRYFVQVRLSALAIILKCFSPRQPHKSYPLNELMEILAFESIEATMDFLEYHGLVLSEDRTHVILDRKLFGMPEYPYAIDRAINVIESKRNCSVGEVVCGGNLMASLYENHIPQNSFDTSGCLDVGGILKELNIDLVEEEKNDDGEEVATEPIKEDLNIFSSVQTIERSKSPLLTTPAPPITGMFAAASENLFGKEKNQTIFGNTQFFMPVKKPINEPTKPILIEKPEIKEKSPELEKSNFTFQPKPDLTQILKQKLEEERQKMEMELQKQKEILERKQREEIEKKKLLEIEKRNVEIEKKKAAEIKMSVTQTMKTILDFVEEKVRNEKLQEFSRKIALKKANRCFKIWRETVRLTRKKRKAIDYGFAWLMPRTTAEEAAELKIENQNFVLSDIKRYKSGKAMEITIPPAKIIQKINIHNTCYNHLLGSLSKMSIGFPKELFWKVTIVLPKNKKYIEEILNSCFAFCNNTNFVLEQRKTVNQNVTYCIEKEFVMNSKTDSNSVIILGENENFIAQNIPIVFIQENTPIDEQIENHYKILNGKFTCDELPKLLVEALKFLAQNLDKPPPLQLDTLKSFLSLHFAGDIWKRISGLAKWNSSYRDCLKNPEIAIKIYNDNLDQLKTIIFDENRKNFIEFPEIFNEYLISQLPEYLPCDYKYFPKFWKSEKYECTLQNTLDSLYISDYVNDWPPENQENLERHLLTYCKNNFKNPERVFYKIMSVILKRSNNFDYIKNLLWSDLMEAIALEKITECDFTFSSTESIFNQLFVVYNSELLNKYVVSSWYYVNYPPIHAKINDLLVKNQVNSRKRKSSERFCLELDIDLEEMLDKVTKKIVDNQERDLQRRQEIDEVKELMSDLKESMEIQRKISSTLENRLKLAIENN